VPRHSEAIVAAIKQAIDLPTLVGSYTPLHRVGSKFKALCPFHDDHNPSLELNPDRQSFKCWACGAGGDVFDFVQRIERIDFPEALRMLAERAGIALQEPTARAADRGPTRGDLLAACAWAAEQYARALAGDAAARAYLERRGITPEQVGRFGLGAAPVERQWLLGRARRAGFTADVLEQAGLAARGASDLLRDRFRGRLIFPIRDGQGRPIGFGGRILPEVEARWAEAGIRVAKYLNGPETALFQKRRSLYGVDLARDAARVAGWVAVVEGYTDVIAAHQVGLPNVVGTLGTALGPDHVGLLRRLAGRVVLVFDGDEAGRRAAERALELFLGHELDLRVLSLPGGLDPCDYLRREGAGPFRALVEAAVDPLEFALARAETRFDLASPEGTRQATEWIVGLLARVPRGSGAGLDVKLAKGLDTAARRLGLPVEALTRRLREVRRGTPSRGGEPASPAVVSEPEPSAIRPEALDPFGREILRIVLNAPRLVERLVGRIAPDELRDAPLRALLRASFELHAEGLEPSFERLARRVGAVERSLAAGLLLPPTADPQPLSDPTRLAAWDEQLERALGGHAQRRRRDRIQALQRALAEIDRDARPDEYGALRRELLELHYQRPDAKRTIAS
jgi:DNA primase